MGDQPIVLWAMHHPDEGNVACCLQKTSAGTVLLSVWVHSGCPTWIDLKTTEAALQWAVGLHGALLGEGWI
jgi:hypothetical protein